MFPFEVDASSNVPPWVQLRQRLVYLIETGYFKPGDQLPTVRGLASEISMNYNTVNKAYISLATDGYIESTRGRGAFVCDLHPDATDASLREVEMILDDCINACRCLGLSYDEISRNMTRKIAQCKRDELTAGAKRGKGKTEGPGALVKRKGAKNMTEQVELTAEDWALRATTCELLAYSLRYPTPEVMEVLVSGDWAGAVVEVGETLGLSAADVACPDFAAEAEDAGEDVVLRALRVEATRLFVGERTPAVSPYEGVWRAQQDGVQPLLFVNPHSMAVERFCKACGLGQPEGTNEPLDHVATELELLQYLAALEAGLVVPFEGGVAVDALPGGSAGAAYRQFWADHVQKWMPDFAAALASDTTQPYYRSVAKLLAAFVS